MTPIPSSVGVIGSLRNYSTDGLIVNLDFSNDYGFSGNTAYDLRNNTILYNTPSGFVTVEKGSTAMPGYIRLDGVTDYLIATGTAADFTGLTSCTVDVWVKVTGTGASHTFFSNNANATGITRQGGAFFYNISDNSLRWNASTGTIITGLVISGVTGTTGAWMNCFACPKIVGNDLNVTGIAFKPNGVSSSNLVTGSTAPGYAGGLTSNNLVAFGRRSVLPQQFLGGELGSVRVYNRILTTEEILFNYNRSKTRYGHT